MVNTKMLKVEEIIIFFFLQVAMATGQILYQRFYYSKSLVKHNYEVGH